MYLYALDPSLTCTGLVIFDTETRQPVLITSYPTNEENPHSISLHQIRSGIVKDGKPYVPGEIAMERVFSKFHKATEALYKVHGVLNELFFAYHQETYVPTTVKLVVAGYGGASKEEVQYAIRQAYPKVKFRNLDESDAFAVAICHMIKKYKMPWNAPFKGKKKTTKKTTTRKKKTVKE